MSHIQVSPDAPLLVRAAADAILYSHIGGAFTGMVSGFVAILAPKGRTVHRWAGNLFFVAMLVMSGVGGVVSPFLGDPASAVAGALTFYLVATAWVTVKRPAGQSGVFEIGALLAAIAATTVAAGIGFMASRAPGGAIEGIPFQVPLVFAGVAALGAICDVRVIWRGGLIGKGRIARHAWRMSLALFVAAGSFAGQPKAVPAFLRGTPIHYGPALLAIALLLFWVIRVQLPARLRKPRATPTSTPVAA